MSESRLSPAASPALRSGAPSGERWFGVGHSTIRDAARAGSEAVQNALRGDTPKLLIVFASEAYDLNELLRGIRERAAGVPLIGCSTAGEIATSGAGDTSVVVTAIGGSGFSVATAAARESSSRLREAGAEAASCLEQLSPKRHRVLMMLTDGLAGDQTEIVRGAYSVVGASVPLVGGCAGDDLKMSSTFQLIGDEVLTDSVVAAAIASDTPLGIGVRHGWRRVGDPMVVTESSNNRVFRIDNKPALDLYFERLDVPEEAQRDPAAFTRFAQTHPLGLSSRSGEGQVRFIGGASFDDRSLGCIAEVPQGAVAWFMEGDHESVLAATDGACSDAVDSLEGHTPLGMIAFDCIARRGVLGEEGIKLEIERVAERGKGAPVAGFYTYGEIARTRGVSGFHNQTLVVLALS